jgi:hypothetical protein
LLVTYIYINYLFPFYWWLMLGFNSSLTQLDWDWKSLCWCLDMMKPSSSSSESSSAQHQVS